MTLLQTKQKCAASNQTAGRRPGRRQASGFFLFLWISLLFLEHVFASFASASFEDAGKPADKRSKTRAAAKLPAETVAETIEAFRGVVPLPGFAHLPDLPSSGVQLFGVQSDGYMAGSEPDSLASFRYLLQGFRCMVMVSVDSLVNLMIDACVPAAQMDPQQCSKFLLNCSESQVQMLVDQKALHVVTQGPHDLLYVPAGMLFVERTHCECDVFGFINRGALVPPLDYCCGDRLQLVLKGIKDAGASTTAIDKVLAFLNQNQGSG